MKVTLAGVTLADSSLGIFAQSRSFSGPIATDPRSFVGATERRVFARGNAGTIWVFASWWTFPALADAHDFYLAVPRAARRTGTLLVWQQGAGAGRAPAQLLHAVLSNVVPTWLGRTVLVEWTVEGGLFTPGVALALPGGDSTGGGGGEAGADSTVTIPITIPNQSLSGGSRTVAVDLTAAALTGAPTITSLQLIKPNADAYNIDIGTPYGISAAGFSVDLGARTQEAGYVLEVSFKSNPAA